jgi:hypothetical protein
MRSTRPAPNRARAPVRDYSREFAAQRNGVSNFTLPYAALLRPAFIGAIIRNSGAT